MKYLMLKKISSLFFSYIRSKKKSAMMGVGAYLFAVFTMSSLSLFGCSKQEESKLQANEQKTFTVHIKPNINRFYYSGEIKPLKVESITAPEEGRVIKINFNYGQAVKAGQHIVTISSEKLQTTFHDAITGYLKAKDSFLNNAASFEGSKELYRDQIVSRQEFMNEKSQYENSELSFMDAKFKLKKVIEMIPGLNSSIEKLTLKDLSEVKKLFSRQFENIELHSQHSGVVLFPVKTASTNDEGDKEVAIGSEVKKGQVLVSVGDMRGLSVEFEVNEAEINRIKPGLKVSVSSSAIDEMKLEGKITAVGVQAKRSASSSEAASFPVRVEVEKISQDIMEKIRVGMTAKVEIGLVGDPALMVPLKAVKNKRGKQYVAVQDSKTNKVEERLVKTGRTTLTDVIVKDGLQDGEKVVVND